MNSQTPINQVTAWIGAVIVSGGLYGGFYGLLKSMEPRKAKSLVKTSSHSDHKETSSHGDDAFETADEAGLGSAKRSGNGPSKDGHDMSDKDSAGKSHGPSSAHGGGSDAGQGGHKNDSGAGELPAEQTEEAKAALKMDHEIVQAKREHSEMSQDPQEQNDEENSAKKGNSLPSKGPKWAYEGKSGVYNWGKLSEEFIMCDKGTKQSPVDFVNTEKDARLQPIEFHYQADDTSLENDGHTLRAKYSGLNNYIKHGDDKYFLSEFHFHTPSEHYVDGAPYDMEVHLVHQNPIGKLIVVGVLMEVRGRANKIIEKIWQDLPLSVGNRGPTFNFNPELFLPQKREFWNYDGSLTTPPCSEGVRWYVLQTPIEMSIRQLDQFQAAYRKNARPPQSLKGRRLLQSRTF